MICQTSIPGANLYTSWYKHNIKCFDELLEGGRFLSVRSLFPRAFLQRAEKEAATWEMKGEVPPWYGFYADRWSVPMQSRFGRIKQLDDILSALRKQNCASSRKDLEARLKNPGFHGVEAFFGVSVLAAALRLRTDFLVTPYARLASARPEFSMSPDTRPIFFEATCFRPQCETWIPPFGEVLTATGISDSRVKNKLKEKAIQLSPNDPNVLVVGIYSFSPSETPLDVAKFIVEGIERNSNGVHLAFLIVLSFTKKSDPAVVLTKEFDCGPKSLSPRERRSSTTCRLLLYRGLWAFGLDDVRAVEMGKFKVKVKLANLGASSWSEEISLLVDTRATLSWIPRATLERLGVKPLSRLPSLRSGGSTIERDVAGVLLTIDGRSVGVSVAMRDDGEKAVLGLTAVEGLGFTVDPVTRKLIPRNLRMLRVGTNEPLAAYLFKEGLGVLALSRIEAEGVRKCFS